MDEANGQRERRQVERDFAAWREHVDKRLNKQDEVLSEIASYLRASKFAVETIKWLSAVGAALAAMWGAIHLGGPR